MSIFIGNFFLGMNLRINPVKTRGFTTKNNFVLRSCFTIFATILCSCFTTVTEQPDEFNPSAEDSAFSGYQVRSYFNGRAGMEWKVVYGSGSLKEDKSYFYESPSSMQLIALDTESTVIEKILNPTQNVCGDIFVSVKLMASSRANLSGVRFLTISLIGGKNYLDDASYSFHQPVRDTQVTDPGQWSRVNMVLNMFKISPTFDCRNISRVRIRLSAQPGFRDTLNFGELAFDPSPLQKAALIITEDDQWADFDTNGLPVMRKYGFPGTIYANCGLLGDTRKMSLERLKTLQDSGGWTIANHMWLHDTITNLTDDSAARSLQHNSEFMQANGLRGFRYFAYPYGLFDRAKDSVVRANSESARLVLGWPEGEALPYPDRYRLRVIGFLDNKVTVKMAKSVLRQIIENKTAGILGVHEIVTSGPLDSRKWLREDWETTMDYVKDLVDEEKLTVYSLEDYMNHVQAYATQVPRRVAAKASVQSQADLPKQ